MAWSLATFLAVPVLVAEDLGPVEAIKRSSQLLKKTWGEQIVGGLSIGLVFGLLAIAVVILGAAAIFALADVMPLAGLAIVVLLVLALLAMGLISSTLGGIYSAAVYDYAMGGSAGEFFREDLIKNAFRPGGRI
jgi:amino acid transporter